MDTTTALAFVPMFNGTVIEGIDAIRSEYDKAYHRWMPHINFIFPYVSCNHFEDHVSRLNEAVKVICLPNNVFIRFDQIGYFKQKNGYTFHLKPDSTSEAYLSKIYHDVILSTLSGDVQIRRSSFHPHLTLAQCSLKDFETMKTKLENWLSSLGSANNTLSPDSIGIVSEEPLNRIVMLHRSPATNDAMMITNQVVW
jgi:2'-5' RNA ligase